MRLIVDGDACPVKDLLQRAALRLGLPMWLVSNRAMAFGQEPGVTPIVVPQGPDEADRWIVEAWEPGDLVITADIPLAARVVDKGGVALDPRGELYTEDNVGERLSYRDLLQELRSAGLAHGGPGQFGMPDRQRFASALDRTLTRMIRGER